MYFIFTEPAEHPRQGLHPWCTPKLRLIMRISCVYLVLSLTVVGFCAANISYGQPADQRMTRIEMENESLRILITKIKGQTGLTFAFPGKVDAYTKINLPMADRTVKEVLDNVLKGTDLRYRAEENTIVIYIEESSEQIKVDSSKSLIDFSALRVTGQITDAATQEALPGVNIIVKGTLRGTTSDPTGKFAIDAEENEILVFSFIGYKTVEVQANSRSVIDIAMESDVTALKAVEIIGTTYYSTTKEKSTMNIAKISAKEIEKQPVTNPLMTLQGRMAGVDITPYNGVAGGAVKIQIRGNNSLRPDGSYPLYIIDGVPIESRPIQSASGTLLGSGIDPLSTLDPAIIESIEVLKDGASTAIYGSRGANGVVRITTKRGHETTKTNFDLSFYSGVGEITNKLKLLNTKQYLSMRSEALANDGIAGPGPLNFDINGTWDNTRNTDWQEVLLGGSATITDIHGALSGGNGKTSFRLGGGYHKENTIYPGDFGYTSMMGNLSVDHVSAKQKLRASLTVNYSVNKNKVFNELNYVNQALGLPPNAPQLYDDDGKLNWQYSDAFDNFPTWTNPLSLLRRTHDATTGQLIANGVLSYEILPGLSGKANLGLTDLHNDELLKIPIAAQAPLVINSSTTGSSTFGNNSRSSWIIEPQLTYIKDFGRHSLDIIVGASWQENRTKYQSITGSGYTSDVLLNSLLGAATTKFDVNDEIHYRYNAFFGRIGYSWKDRYLLDISARRDGSSRFGPGNKFANFAGISGGWIFTKEPFVSENIPFISFGKIRGSYATTGNDQIKDYAYLSTYGIAGNKYHGSIAFYPTALPNPAFAWEETRKLEAAIELGFMEDRISAETSWFRNRSSNQLVSATLPSTTGFDFVLSNQNALIENSGWEFLLTTLNIATPKFKWKTSVNVTIPKNKLVKFDNIEDSPYAKTYKVGEPLNIQRLYTWLGVNPQSGIHEVLDVNKDGFYDDEDKKFSKPVGKRYYGGILNTVTYKAFEFSFLFQFCNQTSFRYVPSSTGQLGNVPVQILARWQSEGDVTDYQKFSTTIVNLDANQRAKQSDWAVVDGSFIRLRTLSLSYRLAGLPIKKVALQDAEVWIQGQNLLTVTDFVSLDPETGNAMPPLRIITIGIRLKF
jgi:TonB-linked SusC/RagA family outer membrane protein